jgi:hypothetical protein
MLIVLPLLGATCSSALSVAKSRQPSELPHALPVVFEPNYGQADPEVRYLARTSMGEVLLTADGITIFQVRGSDTHKLKLAFPGSSAGLSSGENPTGGTVNYYAGRDKSRWISHAPLYGRVRYPRFYPGTDLVFHGSAGKLEYDFEVSAGMPVDPIQVDLGDSSRLHLAPDGSLLVELEGSQFQLQAPIAYQQWGADRRPVRAAYEMLTDHRVGFAVGEYDHNRKLVIDPVVTYGNVLPAAADGSIVAAAVDAQGNLILTGDTSNFTYPVVKGLAPDSSASEEVFVTKIDSTGENILYSTYLPAAGFSGASGLAIDGQGGAYIVGVTTDPSFPVTSVSFGTCSSTFCNAGFTVKLDSTGALSYSTLLGSGQILPKAIVVDKQGDAHIAGLAADGSLQTVNAFQSEYQGGSCTSCVGGFFLELSPDGTSFVHSSYLGSQIFATGIALDSKGDIYVAGPVYPPYTPSVPLLHEFQSTMGSEFLTEFSSDGTALLFGSFLGGYTGQYADNVAGVGVAADGSVYLGGSTQSGNFPYTLNAYRLPVAIPAYGTQMFAMAFTPSMGALKYATYLGDGNMNAMAVDAQGRLYAAGSMQSSSLQAVNAVVADSSSNSIFLELDSTGKPVQVSEFGGHVIDEVPSAMAIDESGNIYLAGNTAGSSAILPMGCASVDPVLVGAGAYATLASTATSCGSASGGGEFVARISPASAPQISLGDALPFLPLHNVGSADLHIKNIALAGGLKKIGGNCGTTVPAGKSCVLTLTDANGKFAQGTVTISSNASPAAQTFQPYGAPQSVGSAVGDLLWVDTSQLFFVGQQMGLASAPQPVQIWNLGMSTLTGLSIQVDGGLSKAGNCSTSLAPGANCTETFSWTPANGVDAPSITIAADGAFGNNYYVPGGEATSDTALMLSQSSDIPFGTQTLGNPAFARSVTVTNVSGSAVAVPSASVSGGSGGFKLAGSTCKGSLQPQQSCAVAAIMNAATAGSYSSYLKFSGSLSASVNLWGNVQLPSAVRLSVSDLEWPGVLLGSSATHTVNVSNSSQASISLAKIAFTLPDYSETDNCKGAIAKSSSCTITVKFAPSQVGERADMMTLTFGGTIPAQQVSLDGTGLFELELSRASVGFGLNNIVGKLSAPISVTLHNLTSKPQSYLLYTSVPFVFANSCANPLPALASCAFNVSFRPMSVGEVDGALSVIVSGATSAKQIPLEGSAYTPPSIRTSSSQLVFPSLSIGTSYSNSLSVTNAGSRQINISSFTILGSGAKDFIVAPNGCSVVGGGASCIISVVFKPSAVGARSATLTISSNATNGPQSVSLSGVGQK